MIKFEDFIDEVVSNFVDELHREAPELEMEDVWSEEDHRPYTRILLWPGEEIPDLIGDLLAKVREGDEAAIKRFLFVFSVADQIDFISAFNAGSKYTQHTFCICYIIAIFKCDKTFKLHCFFT